MENLVFAAPVLGILGCAFAVYLFFFVKKQPVGTDLMKEIAGMIHEGAMAFLKREYTYLAIFIAVVFILLSWKISSLTAIAFLV